MKKIRRFLLSTGMLLSLLFTSCSTSQQSHQTFIPTTTNTITPVPTSTFTPTPTFIPTPQIPVSLGTSIPILNENIISSSNWGEMKEIARWGMGLFSNRFSFSPDNQMLAVPTRTGIHLFSVATGEHIASLPFSNIDGEFLSQDVFVGTDEASIFLILVKDGTIIRKIDSPGINLVISPDRKLLAIIDGGAVKIFNTDTWSQIQTINMDNCTTRVNSLGNIENRCHIIAISSDDKRIALRNYDEEGTQFWNIENNAMILSSQLKVFSIDAEWTKSLVLKYCSGNDCFCGFMSISENLDFSPIGAQFDCNGSTDFSSDGKKWFLEGNIYTLDDNNEQTRTHLESTAEYCSNCLFSNDDKKIAVYGDLGIEILDVQSGKLLTLIPNDFYISGQKLAFSPDGKLLASGNWKGIQIRDAHNGNLIASFDGGASLYGDIWQMIFSPDGKYLLTNQLYLYDTSDWSQIRYYHPGNWRALAAFSPDGETTVLLTKNSVIIGRIADDSAISEIYLFDGERSQYPVSAAFSPDGNYLAVKTNWAVWIWKMPEEELISTFSQGGGGRVGGRRQGEKLSFSPDGKYLISIGQIWRLSDNSIVSIPWVGPDLIFSPDGSMVVSYTPFFDVYNKGEYVFWRTSDWAEIGRMTGQGEAFTFSPDGKFFVIGGDQIIFFGIVP
jgi:WD40 repeat protein